MESSFQFGLLDFIFPAHSAIMLTVVGLFVFLFDTFK